MTALRSLSVSAALGITLAAATAQAAPSSSSSTTSSSSSASTAVKLHGVDPAFYLQKRNRKPDVSQELKALPREVSLAVLRDPNAFLVEASQSKAARAAELRALKQGALTALAQSHADAADTALTVSTLRAALADADVAVAAVAAERLGDVAAVDVLVAVVHDDARIDVRAAAAAGLGRARDVAVVDAALDALVDIVDGADDDIVRAAAVRGLANLTSKWAWQAKGDVATGDRLRARARSAVAAAKRGPLTDAANTELSRMFE